MLAFFVIGLMITGIPLGIQTYLLNEQISELVYEIDLQKEEISKLKTELENGLNKFILKCDLNLISEACKIVGGNVNKIFAVTIEFSSEISEDDVRELNSIGIGFVKVNNSLAHKGGHYLASGSLKALYKAVKREDIIRIKYGFSGEMDGFPMGTYYAGAFANVSNYAEVTVTPETVFLGDWVEINVKNTHPTKQMAFTLIIYHELEEASQVEVFSTARSPPPGMFDYPPYIFLKPGSVYTVQFLPEDSGKYFITPNHVPFTVLKG